MATASAGALSVALKGDDKLSGAIARANANVGRLTVGLKALRSTGGLVTGDLSTLGRVAGNSARLLASIVPPLTVLTAAGSVAGVFRLATGWAAFGAQLGRAAYRVQTTAGRLHALQGAARLAGSSAEELSQGLEGLGDAVIDAAGGRDDTAAMYFRMLGVSLNDAAGNAREATDVLPEVADGIARIADPRLQARVMGALRLPAGLLPFLRKGAAGLREYEAEARRAGVTNEAGAEAARRFQEAQVKLNLAGEGLAYTLAEKLAPTLLPMLGRLSDWIIASGPKLAGIVEDLAKRFEAWVDGGGLGRLGESLGAVATSLESVVGWMDTMGTAATVLGGLLVANLLKPLTGVAGKLGAALLGKAGLLGAGLAAGLYNGAAGGSPPERAELYGVGAGDDVGGRGGRGLYSLLERLNMFLGRSLRPEPVTGLAGGPAGRAAQDVLARVGSGEASERQAAAHARFVALGWTPEQAAGIVGNLPHESGAGLDPRAVGDGGLAYGIAQWHPDRQEEFRRWAGKNIRESTREEQLDFIHYELTAGKERAAGGALRMARTAAGAGQIVSSQYLRPAGGAATAAARGATAERLLEQLRGGGGAARPVASAAPEQQRMQVQITLAGPGSEGATIRTRYADGAVRIERPALGPSA